MAVYNSSKLLLDGIKTLYLDLTTQVKEDENFNSIIIKTQSDGSVERYPVLNAVGGIREWIDDITFNTLEDFYLTVENKAYQEGYLVDRFTLSDSKKTLGAGLETFIKSQADAWANLPKKKIAELLELNPLAFDGTPFFSNTRPNFTSKDTIDNIATGTGTTRTNLSNDLGTAIDIARGFLNAKGEPFNINNNWAVMIHPKFERDFNAINTSEFLANGISNEFKGMLTIVINPYLQDSNDWYLINPETPYKFAVVQEDINNPVKWDMVDNPDERYIKYFTTGRLGFGLLNPLAIIKINNA